MPRHAESAAMDDESWLNKARAEALREAADAVEEECSGSRSACYCTSATWLRERADHLTTPAATGPEEGDHAARPCGHPEDLCPPPGCCSDCGAGLGSHP